MGGIIVYDRSRETHDGPNNYKIYSSKFILGCPYTDENGSGIYKVKTQDEAFKRYSSYFDMMLGNYAFKNIVDEIYTKYKNGETIYLESSSLPSHGDIIVKKIKQRLMKEKIMEIKNNKECH